MTEVRASIGVAHTPESGCYLEVLTTRHKRVLDVVAPGGPGEKCPTHSRASVSGDYNASPDAAATALREFLGTHLGSEVTKQHFSLPDTHPEAYAVLADFDGRAPEDSGPVAATETDDVVSLLLRSRGTNEGQFPIPNQPLSAEIMVSNLID